MKSNIYNINSDDEYSDINDTVFNPSDKIISNKPTTVTRVTSKELTDAESYWLQELFRTKQLFIELSDSSLACALLNNTTYQIPRLKYRRNELNTISIDFTLAEGIIPTGAHAYAIKKNSLEFIDSQMDSIDDNLPNYEITIDGDTDYSEDDYNIHDYQ